MGGKVWSKQEERIFWHLIRWSPKRLGEDLANPEKSYAWMGDQMHARMGDDARRKYTHLCVCEYLFLALSILERAVAEQALIKKREEELAQREQEELAQREQEEAVKQEDGNEADATGDATSPILINCQYPTIPSYHEHAPAPRFTAPSAHTNFASPAFPPPPSHHYLHQSLANHDRLANTGAEDDSLFVTQAPASWVDAAALHRGYGYHHR
ncbi:hypothetical protein C8A01DRAFT_45220 [Parachaetomium inaequale]|uniref:Uncharacterized protein n=1 Tax=Parachaetomium inaequale TaxID=2588326 RepID=A0AAN6PJ97_9PEZI|nr:hypothetical protein C8A01DRAFT_45220 [Parachaetomium inaequale]